MLKKRNKNNWFWRAVGITTLAAAILLTSASSPSTVYVQDFPQEDKKEIGGESDLEKLTAQFAKMQEKIETMNLRITSLEEENETLKTENENLKEKLEKFDALEFETLETVKDKKEAKPLKSTKTKDTNVKSQVKKAKPSQKKAKSKKAKPFFSVKPTAENYGNAADLGSNSDFVSDWLYAPLTSSDTGVSGANTVYYDMDIFKPKKTVTAGAFSAGRYFYTANSPIFAMVASSSSTGFDRMISPSADNDAARNGIWYQRKAGVPGFRDPNDIVYSNAKTHTY